MKKFSLVSVAIVGALTSQFVLADASTVLSWSGQIGQNIADEDYMITGSNGSTSADEFQAGFIDIQPNATFESEHIILEMRDNTGTAMAPVPGELWTGSVTWTVDNISAGIPGVDLQAELGGNIPVIVSINSEDVGKGASYSDTSFNRIGVKVRNETAFDPSKVAGKDLVVELNLSANAA